MKTEVRNISITKEETFYISDDGRFESTDRNEVDQYEKIKEANDRIEKLQIPFTIPASLIETASWIEEKRNEYRNIFSVYYSDKVYKIESLEDLDRLTKALELINFSGSDTSLIFASKNINVEDISTNNPLYVVGYNEYAEWSDNFYLVPFIDFIERVEVLRDQLIQGVAECKEIKG